MTLDLFLISFLTLFLEVTCIRCFNIAGAMFGGLAEYSSMLLRFQYLLFVAGALYIVSIIGHTKVRSTAG